LELLLSITAVKILHSFLENISIKVV